MEDVTLEILECEMCGKVAVFEVLTIYTLPDKSDAWKRYKCLSCHYEFFIHQGGKDEKG